MGCGRGLVAVDRPKEETAEAGGISRPRQRNPILVFGRLTGLFMNWSVQYVQHTPFKSTRLLEIKWGNTIGACFMSEGVIN